jgi:Glycosyl hydrolases family 32 N-terminal domain
MKQSIAFLFSLLVTLCSVAFAEVPLSVSGTWVETPIGVPIIDRGEPGSWNAMAVDNPFVFVEGGVYYCFFEGQDKPFKQGGHEQCGLAISVDGVHWQKLADPIVRVGADGDWDSLVAKLPSGVVRHNRKYYLFYSGRTNEHDKAIGVATADHPLGPWKKFSGKAVFSGRRGDWDRMISTLPVSIFKENGRFQMLYRGMQSFMGGQAVGLAESDNLLRWNRSSRTEGRPVTPIAEGVASLAVAKVPGGYTAISQPMDLKRRAYWHSSDLVNWKKGGPVHLESSGKPSTLSNPFLIDGRWNVVYELDDRIYRAELIE